MRTSKPWEYSAADVVVFDNPFDEVSVCFGWCNKRKRKDKEKKRKRKRKEKKRKENIIASFLSIKVCVHFEQVIQPKSMTMSCQQHQNSEIDNKFFVVDK